MGRRGGSIYISTNPENNVPIGVPGVGVSIGPMGPLIYGRGSDAIDSTSLELDMSSVEIDLTDLEIQAS